MYAPAIGYRSVDQANERAGLSDSLTSSDMSDAFFKQATISRSDGLIGAENSAFRERASTDKYAQRRNRMASTRIFFRIFVSSLLFN